MGINLQELRTRNTSKGVSSIADIKDVTSKLGSCGCVSDLSDGQLSQCWRLSCSWHNLGSWNQSWDHQCSDEGIWFSFLIITLHVICLVQEECQTICKNATDCQGFTHFNANASPFANFCVTFPNIHPNVSIPCSNCVSGTSSCGSFCSGESTHNAVQNWVESS